MDQQTAKKNAIKLQGKKIGGWEVGAYVNSGKSAFVCQASRGGEEAAIKIFGKDVEEFGRDELEERINRQLKIIGNEHENLIKILGGGYCDEAKYFYLVMEFINAPNLAQVLQDVPRKQIGPLISQVAAAAKHLESIGLAHRDIKPANILIEDDFSKAILLDLGVIRPVGSNGFTDSTNSKYFIGTLQYSSPEYLLRKEEDTTEGWRAVTFYQLGAVLHDMIMRMPLFQEQKEPYARLVQAICHENPTIKANDVDVELTYLTKLCLLKKPEMRTSFVEWEDFEFPRNYQNNVEMLKSRIRSRQKVLSNSVDNDLASENSKIREVEQKTYDIGENLETIIRDICITSNSFPRSKITNQVDEQDDVIIHVFFMKSAKDGLASTLTMVFKVYLLDLDSEAIQVQCVGILSDDEYSGEPEVMTDVFEGIFESTIIKAKLDEAIHNLFDCGQGYCESGSDYCDTDSAGKSCKLLMLNFKGDDKT